jgi:Serine hydrolase (FSH1)
MISEDVERTSGQVIMKTIKILCLHGKGTSAEIFRAQTGQCRGDMNIYHVNINF